MAGTLVTDYFSGPCTAVGSVCVCQPVYVSGQYLLNQMTDHLLLAYWFSFSLHVKLKGQGHHTSKFKVTGGNKSTEMADRDVETAEHK